jgi:hypothetical protein
MKKIISLTIVSLIFNLSVLESNEFLYENQLRVPRTFEECSLVEHVKKSIANAEVLKSHLKEAQLKIPGMSSEKVRHFLNQLCGLPDCTYLEVGSYKGSTLIGALYGHQKTLLEATACDNWSEFEGPRSEFLENCDNFLSGYPLFIHECDSFNLDLRSITYPVKVYFYDGNHSFEAQEKAFTYYDAVFEDLFVAVVDDWNWSDVREGTFAAFKKLGYKILFEKYLPARFNQDTENYWNGLYVVVISKK